MKKLESSAIILGLIKDLREHDSRAGETHIQKSAYFLKAMMKVPIDFDFILYKYGPYSFELSEQLEIMRAYGYVDLQSQLPYGATFNLAENSEVLFNHYKNSINKYQKGINFVTKALAQLKVKELERLATALYVTVSGNDDREQKICEIKNHISFEEAKKAIEKVDEMLVKAAQIQ